MDSVNSVYSFGLFPRAPRFLLQRIAGSGYGIDRANRSYHRHRHRDRHRDRHRHRHRHDDMGRRMLIRTTNSHIF